MRFKKARKAQQKLEILADRQILEQERCMGRKAKKQYADDLKLYTKVIQQKRNDKDEIYSQHKPFTCCIAKGKALKPYELGNYVGLIVNPKSLIVLAIESFACNPLEAIRLNHLLIRLNGNYNTNPKRSSMIVAAEENQR